MDNVIVYKTNEESLQVVLGLLRKEGFNPTTREDPVIIPYRGRTNHVIHIAVPRDEVPGAASVLRKWDEAQMSKVNSAIQKLAGPFLCSAMIASVMAVILLFLGVLLEVAALLFLVWLVVFALLANVEKIVQKLEKRRKR